MRNNIAIVTCYMGKLPNYFPVWLKSCEHNPDVDFIVVTDQTIMVQQRNVQVVNMDLPAVKKIADHKLGLNTALFQPYKLCDFKPVFGILFEEYLKQYDFWGHCDIDLIFGNIRNFVTDELLKAYDRILYLGHLSIYRNTKEVNSRYKLAGADLGYAGCFTTDVNCGFDEWAGLYNIYKKHKFPMYEKEIYADFRYFYKRLKVARQTNYNYQLFFWDNGELKRAFIHKNRINYECYLYAHYQKRQLLFNELDILRSKSFAILPNGFRKINVNDICCDYVMTHSNYKGVLYDIYDYLKYQLIQPHGRWVKNKLKFNAF